VVVFKKKKKKKGAVTFLQGLPTSLTHARPARAGERRGGTVSEHDLRLVLRLAKRVRLRCAWAA